MIKLRTLICLCIMILGIASISFGNDKFSLILMKSTRNPLAQAYMIDTALPMKFIHDQWKAGYHISELSMGDYRYSVIMNGGMIPQKILTSDSFPELQLRDNLALGMSVTSVTGFKGKWHFVMSLDQSIMNHIVLMQGAFPKAKIEEYWNMGYRIGVLDFVNGKWIVTMNRLMMSTGQSYFISDTLPTQNSKKLFKGMSLRSCKKIDDKYLFVLDGYAQEEKLIDFSKNSSFREGIDSAWAKGYALISLQMNSQPMTYLSQNIESPIEIVGLNLYAIPQDSITHEMFHKHILSCKDFPSSSIAMRRRAQGYLLKNDTLSAISMYAAYRITIPSKKTWIDSSISLLANPIESIEKMNLGNLINTSGSEWDPVPSPDGSSLYLSVRDRVGGEGRQDVFVATRNDSSIQGEWSRPISIGSGVNTQNGEETIDNVSTDGNTLFLSGTFPGSYGMFDIYTAERTPTGWDNLRQMPRPINSEFHDESGCLSSDGKVLLFSSDRPGAIGDLTIPMSYRIADGTHGNMDLWACIKTDTGWTEPINLGATINTPFSERSLFLHPDGKSLYFSSNGHPGLGGLDVYVSYRLKEDSWTEWSIPQNLGRAINTIDDDFSYKISVSGDTAYYAAQDAPGGYGQWDVYRVVLPKNVRPQQVASISGKVFNKTTGKPITATIIWEDLQTGKTVGSSKVHPNEGTYFIVLPLGKKYGYYASADGYFPTSSNIDLRNQKISIAKSHDIRLSKMPDSDNKEITIELSNVFFEYGSSSLLEESHPELSRLATIIREKGYDDILIAGHTDDKGSDLYNDRLSLQRANSVKKHLISLGISSNLLKTKGFGKRKPRFTEQTEVAKAGNRRVEVTITGR